MRRLHCKASGCALAVCHTELLMPYTSMAFNHRLVDPVRAYPIRLTILEAMNQVACVHPYITKEANSVNAQSSA